MGRGRPKDTAPEGFYTVAEAAELLGITPSAVRQRIARGSLSTGQGQDVTGRLEPRHYIPKEEVESVLAEQSLPATHQHVDTSTEVVLGKVDDMIAKFKTMAEGARDQRLSIEQAVKNQDEHITDRLGAVERNQETIISNLQSAIQVLRDTAEAARKQAEEDRAFRGQEKIYQDRMIEMLDREAERQEQREQRGLPERRSLWRRLFGD